MECESSLIVDGNFKWLLHKLLASCPDLSIESCREHLNLLLVGSHLENRLDVTPHVQGFQHFVALIKNKVLYL